MSITVVVSIRTMSCNAKKKRPLFSAQISCYDNNNEYLVFIFLSYQDPFKKDHLRSISVGILISAAMKRSLNVTAVIKKELVGVTCETCAVKTVRSGSPVHLRTKAE
jgi:hypothetical protein